MLWIGGKAMYEEDIKKCRELITLIEERLKQEIPPVERMLNEYKLGLTKKRMATLEQKQKEKKNDR